jgi:hypothetical protein
MTNNQSQIANDQFFVPKEFVICNLRMVICHLLWRPKPQPAQFAVPLLMRPMRRRITHDHRSGDALSGERISGQYHETVESVGDIKGMREGSLD